MFYDDATTVNRARAMLAEHHGLQPLLCRRHHEQAINGARAQSRSQDAAAAVGFSFNSAHTLSP